MPLNQNTVAASSGTNVQLTNVFLDVYAQEILMTAQPVLRFESIVTKRTDLAVKPGGTLRFLKYASLSGSSVLAETDTIQTDTLSTSTIAITVAEYAKAIAVSELALRQAITDVMGDAAELLGQHYAKERDGLCRDAFYLSTNTLYSQHAGVAATRADLTASSTFDIDLLRDAVELLATNKAPKYGLDAYVCFVHPHQSKYIRKDPAWINANNYATPQNILVGEIGRMEDVRFVETTQVAYIKKNTQDIWTDGTDSGKNTIIAANAATDVYQSIITGQNAVGMAEALPVEMRDDGIQDFGRRHSLAYYGIWGAGQIESTFSAIIETA